MPENSYIYVYCYYILQYVTLLRTAILVRFENTDAGFVRIIIWRSGTSYHDGTSYHGT